MMCFFFAPTMAQCTATTGLNVLVVSKGRNATKKHTEFRPPMTIKISFSHGRVSPKSGAYDGRTDGIFLCTLGLHTHYSRGIVCLKF